MLERSLEVSSLLLRLNSSQDFNLLHECLHKCLHEVTSALSSFLNELLMKFEFRGPLEWSRSPMSSYTITQKYALIFIFVDASIQVVRGCCSGQESSILAMDKWWTSSRPRLR
jgi:hypothetical protein